MNKFCVHCGTQLEDGQLFCGNCGKKVDMPQQVKEEINSNVSPLPGRKILLGVARR